MTVRAKFWVTEKAELAYQPKPDDVPVIPAQVTVKMKAVYSNDPKHENKSFWDATPSGELQMIVKGDVSELFVLGQEYYLDFTPAPRSLP